MNEEEEKKLFDEWLETLGRVYQADEAFIEASNSPHEITEATSELYDAVSASVEELDRIYGIILDAYSSEHDL